MGIWQTLRYCIPASMVALAAIPALADRLDDVKARGKLVVGISDTTPPFSFRRADGVSAKPDVSLGPTTTATIHFSSYFQCQTLNADDLVSSLMRADPLKSAPFCGMDCGMEQEVHVKSGPHKTNKLTAMTVKKAVAPGRYADGNGLYLVVEKSGAKRWVFRSIMRGRRTDMGLGSVNLVPLAEAREKAIVYKKEARGGGDPIATRRTHTYPLGSGRPLN